MIQARPSNGVDRRGPPLGLRFFLLAALCVTLMVLDHRDNHLNRIRNVLSVVVYPIQRIVDLPFYASRWVGRSFNDRTELLEENDRLKRQQINFNVRLQKLAMLEAENARLRAILESSAKVADRVLIAEILSVDLDPYRHRFAIDKGLTDGVYVGQALLDAGGVVGQVIRAEPLSSEAVFISDADHALPIRVNRNGLRTLALGTGNLRQLQLPYLPNNADIEAGDLLVSSGLGEAFPAGYPVAEVTLVERMPGEPFARILAVPTASLDRDREVLLVWPDPDPVGNDTSSLAGVAR
jgi:rod shape-determining protein MreC